MFRQVRSVTLASLDSSGSLIVWQVLESETAEYETSDYGQSVGGRVRLVSATQATRAQQPCRALAPARTSRLPSVLTDPRRLYANLVALSALSPLYR